MRGPLGRRFNGQRGPAAFDAKGEAMYRRKISLRVSVKSGATIFQGAEFLTSEEFADPSVLEHRTKALLDAVVGAVRDHRDDREGT